MTNRAWAIAVAIVLLWKMRRSVLPLLVVLTVVWLLLRAKKPCLT